MNIKIKEQTYKLSYTIRGLFIFEQITDRQFNAKSTIDFYLLFYSLLLANNSDNFKLSFDEFINECDSNKQLFIDFLEFINKEFDLQNQFAKQEEDDDTDKKKV